jgi:class 3 adenylate cyclase
MSDSAATAPPATVLLVDDEPRVLDSLEAMLGMHYSVLRSEHPGAALDMLARERVAVIISDQRMPGMLGTDLLSKSLEVSPETVRILLTAFTDADALMASINAANIYHFVLKPWDPKELLHIVGQGVQRYRLGEERERLVRDLARKNADLEAAVAELHAAQGHAVREAALRTQLQRYVSPRLVDMVVANPALLAVPGEWRQATVLFADIRGYTRLIETTPAPVTLRLMDEYFNRMTDVIFGHHGTVEQLVGDEIVALFGVPEGAEDAAARAIDAAVDMIDGVRDLGRRWRQAGWPTIDIGIGLSSGEVMVETIGSDRRRELIVVGRPMIAAARIQRMTRLFGAHIIAGEETFRQVSDSVSYRELGTPRLKGLRARTALFEIFGKKPTLAAVSGSS